jgi:hypothetical protein
MIQRNLMKNTVGKIFIGAEDFWSKTITAWADAIRKKKRGSARLAEPGLRKKKKIDQG